MDNLRELQGCTSTDTLNFFFQYLQDDVGGILPQDQIIYAASVLAHYAQTSCGADYEVPAPRTLIEIFDRYILEGVYHRSKDHETLEFAGAEILFLNGFFRKQMSRRHNIAYFDGLGRMFYARASYYSPPTKQRRLMSD